jgi:hypothetical protein
MNYRQGSAGAGRRFTRLAHVAPLAGATLHQVCTCRPIADRHGETVTNTHGNACHTLKRLHRRGRGLVALVSLAQLPAGVIAPRVDPAIPAEGEAVPISGDQAPHPNCGHRRHGYGGGEGHICITVAQFSTAAACQQPTRRIHRKTLMAAGSHERRLQAAALPRAKGQVCDS